MSAISHATRRASAVVVLLTALVTTGCAKGPARTAGTGNLPPEQLALVHIIQHGDLTVWKGQPIHIETFYIGEAAYAIKDDKDFYVPPGKQTFTIDYGPCAHGWAQVEAPFNDATGVFAGPYGRWDGTLEAGREYVVTATSKLVGKDAVHTEHAFKEVPATVKPK